MINKICVIGKKMTKNKHKPEKDSPKDKEQQAKDNIPLDPPVVIQRLTPNSTGAGIRQIGG
ncbi:hypothetical protein [Kamptonema formosum]|uniref:hypothetical protein n=1 Tax=Kamptonema formosum TaxID=331992 RepID=UPI000477389B|nr:hypothetical protein [Oscillatoria sp. PCC 10802]